MKTLTINKKINLGTVFSVLSLFFIISGIAFAEQKIGLSPFDSKDIYTSPDGRYQAITIQKNEEVVQTYILDENGRTIIKPHTGSFVSWSPDSSKVILFLSETQSPKGRELYILDTDGSYKNSGLPVGTISAYYSSSNSDIVYSLTRKGTDNSDIYVRSPEGEDSLIMEGGQNILTWLRWSPHGDKILFMQSDLLLRPGNQYLWIMDSDGSNKEKITPIDWDYPAAWSPDGMSIAFANAGDIWEYSIQDKTLKRLTNQDGYQLAMHPEYSLDGETITYIAKSRYTENILSLESSNSNAIKDSASDLNNSGNEIASSTSENKVTNSATTASSVTEDQLINL
ncbi:MAG: hypothetical protein ABIT47_02780 [Candidatus Paceibacterota bacterium]